VDINRFISSKNAVKQTPQTVYVFKDFNQSITQSVFVTKIWSKNTFTSIALVGSSFDRNHAIFEQLRAILRLQFNMKIGIFFKQTVLEDDLNELFKWCKENLIVHVFAASYASVTEMEVMDGPAPMDELNIFTFNHFGTFIVTNVTTSETLENDFPGLQSNFQQHQFRMEADNSFGEYLYIVLRLMNGSLLDGGNRPAEGALAEPDIYQIFLIKDFIAFDVYPLFTISWSIVVPYALPYEDFSDYLRIIGSGKFFGFSLITIAVVMFVLSVCRYMKESIISIFETVADVLNLLLNDNGSIRYQKLSRAEVLVICPLTFVGLIVVNGILSIMQSYLTEPVLQPQIKSLEDIHNSPFSIVTFHELNKYTLMDELFIRTKYRDWGDRVDVMEWEQFYDRVHNFNTSISFYDQQDSIDFIFRLQKLLNIKAYYNPKIQIANWFFSYKIFKKFLFYERFNEITHRMHSAGLINLWWRKEIDKMTHEVIGKNREKIQQEKDVAKIEFPSFIVYGWIAGIVLFIVEIIWKKFVLLRIQRLSVIFSAKFRKFCIILAGMFRPK